MCFSHEINKLVSDSFFISDAEEIISMVIKIDVNSLYTNYLECEMNKEDRTKSEDSRNIRHDRLI